VDAGFPKEHAQTKKIERDADSTKRIALYRRLQPFQVNEGH
jgi:hypothetical protein